MKEWWPNGGGFQSKRSPTWINTCIFPDLNMSIYAPDILDCSTHTQDHYHPDCVSFLSNIPIYHNHTHLTARMTSEQHGESKHFHMGKVMKVQWGMQCSCALHQHSFPPRLDSASVQEDEITVTRQWQWHAVDFVHKNCFAGFLFGMMTAWWGFFCTVDVEWDFPRWFFYPKPRAEKISEHISKTML